MFFLGVLPHPLTVGSDGFLMVYRDLLGSWYPLLKMHKNALILGGGVAAWKLPIMRLSNSTAMSIRKIFALRPDDKKHAVKDLMRPHVKGKPKE